MPCLRVKDMLRVEFVELVKSFFLSSDALVMAFSPAEAIFDHLKSDHLESLPQTDQGRIFSPAGEFRWRDMGNGFRTVYLGETPGPETLNDCSEELTGLSARTRTQLLWGVRTNTENEWLEQSVPHRFSYPILTKQFSRGRAGIVVEEWVDKAGLPYFSRYHSLIEVKGGE